MSEKDLDKYIEGMEISSIIDIPKEITDNDYYLIEYNGYKLKG